MAEMSKSRGKHSKNGSDGSAEKRYGFELFYQVIVPLLGILYCLF
jgi:hypothetical protein